MSRRVRRTVIACRASMAGAAAVVLLAACGGGDSGADSSATGSAAEPDAGRVDAAAGWEPAYLRASGAQRGVAG